MGPFILPPGKWWFGEQVVSLLSLAFFADWREGSVWVLGCTGLCLTFWSTKEKIERQQKELRLSFLLTVCGALGSIGLWLLALMGKGVLCTPLFPLLDGDTQKPCRPFSWKRLGTGLDLSPASADSSSLRAGVRVCSFPTFLP